MGHIPKDESINIDVLKFEESQKSNHSSCNYDRSKWIYFPDFYSEYRYILGTIGKNSLITIGINPSTAHPNCVDNTIKSVERLAINNGFDSFIMCNVYAQRSTEPNSMDKNFNEKLHLENLNAFRWIFEKVDTQPIIWAAWGTNIDKRDYLKACLIEIEKLSSEYNSRWVKAGNLSKKGHPHHPLYLPKNTIFEECNIKKYMSDL